MPPLSPTAAETAARPSRDFLPFPSPAGPASVPAPEPVGADVRFRMVLTALLYAIPLVVTLRPVGTPVLDPDVWWHLRVGQWVVEHRAVPANDPFSAYGLDRPWVAYSWLYEVLIYGLYSAFGLAGVVLYRAALALAVAAALRALVLRAAPRFLTGAALTGLALLTLAMLFSERPWAFTILFSTWTLHAVLDLREGKASWRVWLLPAAFALWANLHIQFIYGLILLGLGCTAPLFDRALGLPAASGASAGSPGWRRLVLLTFLCLLATLVNPYHAHLYEVVVEYATQPGPFRFVNELRAPEFREPCDWAMLAFAAAATFALGRRRRLGSFEVLLLGGAAVLAFRARRDLWFLVLAALVVLARPARGADPSAERFAFTPRRRLALAGGLALLALVVVVARGLTPDNLERKAAGVFPAGAARHVAEQGYSGPLYNHFNWGGYLIWALPQLPVALDGRTNLHGDERLLRFGATWAGAPGWHDDPDLAAAGVVIADPEMPLTSLLEHDDRFVLVHADPVARVFVARRAARP